MLTDHPQVPFRTLDGVWTEVDEGMYDILIQLRSLGVRTQFSCQNEKGFQTAYICANHRSFNRALRKIKKTYKKGLYSSSASQFAERLFRGYRNWEFGRTDKKGFYRRRRLQYSTVPSLFVIERCYNPKYGLRLVLRWPRKATDDFLQLLKETRSQKIHRL